MKTTQSLKVVLQLHITFSYGMWVINLQLRSHSNRLINDVSEKIELRSFAGSYLIMKDPKQSWYILYIVLLY